MLLLFVLLAASGLATAVEPADGEPITAGGTHPIIRGQDATEGRPWMVSLIRITSNPSAKMTERHFCGGVLIAETWVLTAAHCIEGLAPGTYQAVIGALDLGGSSMEVHDVIEQIKLPFFDPEYGYYADIALLRLKTASSNQPASLATKAMGSDAHGTTLQVLGWGNSVWNDSEVGGQA